MSNSTVIKFGDRWLEAYDVSRSVLLTETARVGEQWTGPAWLPQVLRHLRLTAGICDLAWLIDRDWPREGLDTLIRLLEAANQRLLRRGVITAAEARELWPADDQSRLTWQPGEVLPAESVVALGETVIALIRGTLPPDPPGAPHCYGSDRYRELVHPR
ncbi:hypothetical protein [Nocardia stercoris]|uniref:Uncharacterized protein n=1 Tax=Nocardia stercoris TaxID=2483361 RepID=A0A3M2KUM1_9NOCA|nr:hypothetical protein [Nocardia stercoris]RMI27923.1 hypothetical protein EBN03_32315 [Nocardia stercoris]